MVVSFTGIANVVQSIRPVTPSSLTRCFLRFPELWLRRVSPPPVHGRKTASLLCRVVFLWPPGRQGPPVLAATVAPSIWNCLEPFRRYTHTPSPVHSQPLLLSPRAQQNMRRREGITRNINNINKWVRNTFPVTLTTHLDEVQGLQEMATTELKGRSHLKSKILIPNTQQGVFKDLSVAAMEMRAYLAAAFWFARAWPHWSVISVCAKLILLW